MAVSTNPYSPYHAVSYKVRLWPLLKMAFVEIVACTGQTDRLPDNAVAIGLSVLSLRHAKCLMN